MRKTTGASAPAARCERRGGPGAISLATALVAAAALSVQCGSASAGAGTGTPTPASGMPVACVGPGGCSGVQVSMADGTGLGACECSGAGGGDAASNAGDAAAAGDGGANDAGGADGPTQPPAGPVAVSTTGTSMGTEVQLAAAPDGTLAIAWIDIGTVLGGGGGIAYRFSTNGGATFSPIATIPLPATILGSDPALTVDASGNFYLALLGVHYAGMSVADSTRVYVATAKKGSEAFGAAVEVTDPATTSLYDHPKILATASGTVVVAFTDLGVADAATGIGVVATSTDGQTWQRGTIVESSDAVYPAFFWLCEGTGILYTTYLEASATTAYIALRTSTDDGATWSPTSTVVSELGEFPASLDTSCVASGSEAWVEYATNDMPPADPTTTLDPAQAIRIAHLTSNGGSLDSTRVNALDTTADPLGLLPVLVREPSGAMDVAYLSGKAEGDSQGSMRYGRAVAPASPFMASVALDGPLLFTMSRTKRTWLGDYLGAVYSGGRLLVAYPMNASGTTHVFFRSVLLP